VCALNAATTPPAACTALPKAVGKRLATARAQAQKAVTKPHKTTRLLGKANKLLAKATAAVEKAVRKHKLTEECGAALLAVLGGIRTQITTALTP
jgi:hypothetical protein